MAENSCLATLMILSMSLARVPRSSKDNDSIGGASSIRALFDSMNVWLFVNMLNPTR